MSTLEINLGYSPKPKQIKFHQSEAKYRSYVGAWRAGKTYAGCYEGLKKSILNKNNFGLIGRKNFSDLRDTTIKTFFDICPRELIKSYNKSEHRLTFVNGSVILFRELKDMAGMGSLELGWFYIDEAEQVLEEIFTYLKGRLSKLGCGKLQGWLTTNPPNKDHWIYKTFEIDYLDDPEYIVVHASTYENKEYLPQGYIADLEKLPESWRKKYLEGQYGFTPAGDPFYSGYIESFHRRKLQFNINRPIIRSWDYGYWHPAVTFHQIDAKGRWLILREDMGEKITIETYGQYIKTMCKEWFPNAEFSDVDYGDPAGNQKSDKSEKTSVEILASIGIYVTSQPSTYRDRKEIIERRLTTIIDGLPALMVDANCGIVNDGFLGGYHYPVRKQGQAFDPKIFEIPYKDGYYDHCLSGDTKIRTLNGWHFIKDLVGKSFITYTYDSFSKRLIPAKARDCRKTQSNIVLWKLKMDIGELIATPDHLIMLRNGSFRQLKDLKLNDELMPFYEKQRSKKGHCIINLNDSSIVDEHRYIYNWFNGNLKEGHHIHHKDGNPRNNYPENLEQLTRDKHMAGVYEKMRKHPTVKAMRNGSLNPWTKESREKVSIFMKLKWKLGDHPLSIRIDKFCDICKKVYSASPRQKYCKKCSGKARNFREKKKLAEMVNHKVIFVEFYGYGDTYNFEVDTFHNFPANGIMVHNCMNTVEYFAVNHFTGAESKEDTSVVIVKVAGDLKDIKIEIDDEESNRSRYLQNTRVQP